MRERKKEEKKEGREKKRQKINWHLYTISSFSSIGVRIKGKR